MKVGLNATCLNDRPSGARQRFQGIYGSLVRLLPNVEFIVYEPSDCRVADWFSGAPNVSACRTPLPTQGRLPRLVVGARYWSAHLKREKLDLLECFSEPVVKAPRGSTITTIHDIRRVHGPWHSAERAAYSLSLRQTFSKVDQVITVSEAMKAEILAFDARPHVSVIYNGIDPQPFREVTAEQQEAVKRRLDLPQEFLLAVGHFEPRKNYDCLIEAVARLQARRRECFLVIVGNDSGNRPAIEAKIQRLNLRSRVKIFSGLSDDEVRSLYCMCQLFVFPSKYEGFGIPILEAMAAGVPYVLSDIPVFREITQNKGVYFPQDDAEAFADVIETTLEAEATRQRLVEFGSQRVLDFTFPRLAEQVADLYHR